MAPERVWPCQQTARSDGRLRNFAQPLHKVEPQYPTCYVPKDVTQGSRREKHP